MKKLIKDLAIQQISADINTRKVLIEPRVVAETKEDCFQIALASVSAALHKAGKATPGWENILIVNANSKILVEV